MSTELQDHEVIHEFLVESHENLTVLDQELVELEKRPNDAELLASIFRTIHTIKGTCGFLAFSLLEKTTHEAESLLSTMRDGLRELTPETASLILEAVDATRKILASIEASGKEGPDHFEDLRARLRAATAGSAPAPAPVVADSVPEPKLNEDAAKPSAVADANVRVGVALLDKLMDLVGELVLTRNQILQFNSEREDPALNATSQRLNLITTELQEGVMKTRMQPIGMVWSKLPRLVRDISVSLGKQIRLEMEGAATELDRTIIEAIKDPLVHLVRNSCDHGIERPGVRTAAGKPAEGRLTLRAYHEGGQVNIEIADDGAGIDIPRIRQKAVERGLLQAGAAEALSEREVLNLLFQPGFSTAAKVTSVSGRGVGLDVVKSNIDKTGGAVDIIKYSNEGTTFKLKIPLTLAIIPGLVITSGGERFVIPQVSLLELIRLDGDTGEKQIEYVHGTPVYRRRGSLLPITWLNRVLDLPGAQGTDAVTMIVLQAEDRQFGLVVDHINDTQEIVVKPLGKQLKGLNMYAGATTLGDGRVALILDVLGLGQRSGVLSGSGRQQSVADPQSQPETALERLLLFRSGSFDRLAVPLSLVARLEKFPRSAIERAGGCQVVQYRQSILPLVVLQSVLEPGTTDPNGESDPVDVVVFDDGAQSVGLVVGQILDVAEEEITARRSSRRPGLLGSAVTGGQITDFVDLNHVIHASAPDWFGGRSFGKKRILIAESSAFSRGLIRGELDMAGYRVTEAASLDEAIRGLERRPVDIVVAALDLPPDGCSALLAAMRGRVGWEGIPVLALADRREEIDGLAVRAAGFDDCQTKFDREAMLESIARLAAAVETAGLVPAGAGKD